MSYFDYNRRLKFQASLIIYFLGKLSRVAGEVVACLLKNSPLAQQSLVQMYSLQHVD